MSTPQTATQFVNTLGVNVHIEYTDGKYANATNVVADLAYLGETHVRDAVLNPANQGQGNYETLAAAGIKFDFFWQATDLTSTLALVDAFVKRHPGAVDLIEGPNEVNNFPISYAGLTGNAAATAYQAALNSAVHGDTLLRGVPVADLTSWPFLSGPSDDANYHFYPFGGAQPKTAYGPTAFSDLAALEPGKPMVMTEGGYNTLLTDGYFGGVDEATQAKLTLNLYCDNAAAGVSTSYIYQLLDAYADPTNSNSDSHFGLFHLDNTPKLAATAIHNLTMILSSGADASAAASSLAYSISNLPSSGGALSLTKNATTHDLLVWSEPTIWDGAVHAPIVASPTSVTIHLAAASDVVIYDPLTSTQPIASYHGAQDITATVTDHPLIVEVIAIAGQVAPVATPQPPAVNHAPTLTGASTISASDRSLVSPFATMVVADPDAGQSETVTVSFSGGGVLAGGGFSQISTGVYRVTAASAAAAQADLRALTFTPTTEPAGSAATPTTFTVTVTDGQASATDASTTVTALHTTNTAVTLGGLVAGQAMTDKSGVSPFRGATIVDPDFGQTETVTVTLSSPSAGALSGGGFTAVAGASGAYLYAAGSAAQAQAALRALVFTPAENVVAQGLTSTVGFAVQVSDGVSSVRDGSTTETILSVNDAPRLSGLQTATAAVGGGSVVLQPSLSIADPDVGSGVAAAKIAINGYVAGDLLAVSAPQIGVASTFDRTSGVLTLTGSGSDAAYAQALRSVSFSHDGAVSAGARNLVFSVTDDGGATVTASETVTLSSYAPPEVAPSVTTQAAASSSATSVTSVTLPAAAGDGASGTSTATAATTATTATTAPVANAATSTAATSPQGASGVASGATVPSDASTLVAASPPSTLASFTTQTENLLRVSGAAALMSDSHSALASMVQTATTLAGQVDAGQISAAAAQSALLHLADGTTSVAQLTYAFFTGATPTAAGLGYLVHSDANPSDLNDAYYSHFSMQNRYINFSVALAKEGAGTAAYHQAYDGLTLSDATSKAYAAVFGAAASSAQISTILDAAVSNGAGGTETRADYFAAYGGDGVNGAGTKAAMIGWLLAESVSEGVGVYQAAETQFLQALGHGTAQFGVDLLSVYAIAPTLVGAVTADPTLGR